MLHEETVVGLPTDFHTFISLSDINIEQGIYRGNYELHVHIEFVNKDIHSTSFEKIPVKKNISHVNMYKLK